MPHEVFEYWFQSRLPLLGVENLQFLVPSILTSPDHFLFVCFGRTAAPQNPGIRLVCCLHSMAYNRIYFCQPRDVHLAIRGLSCLAFKVHVTSSGDSSSTGICFTRELKSKAEMESLLWRLSKQIKITQCHPFHWGITAIRDADRDHNRVRCPSWSSWDQSVSELCCVLQPPLLWPRLKCNYSLLVYFFMHILKSI